LTVAPGFLVIPPDAVFTMASLRATLGIKVSLKYEVRRVESNPKLRHLS
jgi:hypothetical protein